MDGAIHTTASEQGCIRRVDNCIYTLRNNVALDNSDPIRKGWRAHTSRIRQNWRIFKG